jgi:riboflavin transporter FmnP
MKLTMENGQAILIMTNEELGLISMAVVLLNRNIGLFLLLNSAQEESLGTIAKFLKEFSVEL